MTGYYVRLKLYDSEGGNMFQIDQDRDGSADTHIDTTRVNVVFNKPVSAPEIQTSGGASLSWLEGLSGITTDVKSWVDGLVSGATTSSGDLLRTSQKGSTVHVVSPDISEPLTNHYTTIQAAVNAAADGETVYILNGHYAESVVLDPLKSVTLVGETRDGVVISSASSITDDIISQSSIGSDKSYAVKNMTLRTGRYGIRCDASTEFSVQDVRIERCGWNGTAAGSEERGWYGVLWASANTSDGGGIYVASSTGRVSLKDIEVEQCARGIHLQSCTGGGRLSRIDVLDTLSSGITLDSASGGGGDGCANFAVSESSARCCRANGIRIVGGQNIHVTGCSVEGAYNAGLQLLHTVRCDVVGTALTRCNTQSYTGTGVLGDAQGTVAVKGELGVPASEYTLNASGCVFSCGGSGGEAVAYAIHASDVTSTVNVSGCGYICFDVLTRVNDPALVTDAQQNFFASQLANM